MRERELCGRLTLQYLWDPLDAVIGTRFTVPPRPISSDRISMRVRGEEKMIKERMEEEEEEERGGNMRDNLVPYRLQALL